MDGPLQQVVDESIRLERNVGRLYILFSRLFEQDSDFWWKIAVEEGHHASMLKSAKAAFIDEGMFPSEVFATTLDTLLALNQEIEGHLTRFEQNPPTRSAALDLAHRLENIRAQRQVYGRLDAEAITFVRLQREGDGGFYGIGFGANIDQAAVRAIIASLNRMLMSED